MFGLRALCRRPFSVKPTTFHVVGHVDQGAHRLGSGLTDGADEEAHRAFLFSKDMRDARADFRLRGIGGRGAFGHWRALGLLAADLADLAVGDQEILIGLCTIGGVGPDR